MLWMKSYRRNLQKLLKSTKAVKYLLWDALGHQLNSSRTVNKWLFNKHFGNLWWSDRLDFWLVQAWTTYLLKRGKTGFSYGRRPLRPEAKVHQGTGRTSSIQALPLTSVGLLLSWGWNQQLNAFLGLCFTLHRFFRHDFRYMADFF